MPVSEGGIYEIGTDRSCEFARGEQREHRSSGIGNMNTGSLRRIIVGFTFGTIGKGVYRCVRLKRTIRRFMESIGIVNIDINSLLVL